MAGTHATRPRQDLGRHIARGQILDRNGADHRGTLGEPPVSSMSVEHITPAIEARAVEIQMLLADRGQHRAPSIPDLLIAATAELSRLTVLHVGKDFELIAAITDQPIERLGV